MITTTKDKDDNLHVNGGNKDSFWFIILELRFVEKRVRVKMYTTFVSIVFD